MHTVSDSTAREASPRYQSLIAESPAMRRVMERAERVAKADLGVILTGETGTGKEVVAHSIHAMSGRPGPFVAVNCAGLDSNLADRELFGHVRGTFTGADRDARGLCQAAFGGTLFLDEVGELDILVQAKLLRLLSGGEIRRLGATQPEQFTARVIAATNRDLCDEVLAGRFREDLYHRLAGVTLKLPPLRRRPEEIPILVDRFLRDLAPPHSKITVGPTTIAALIQYTWPGNVRELRQAIARALVFGGDALAIEDFDLCGDVRRRANCSAEPDRGRWCDIEKTAIADALERHGTIRGAARALGRPKSTVADRVRHYGLRP